MLAVKYYNLWHSNSAAIYCINITVEFASNAKRKQSWVGKPHDYPRCFKAAFSVFVCVCQTLCSSFFRNYFCWTKIYKPSIFFLKR